MEQTKFSLPTETVELPSKGLLYPIENPLSSGTIEMKYMTAKEEDILTNQNYISKGIVLDKLLQSLIVSKIDSEEENALSEKYPRQNAKACASSFSIMILS